MAIGSLPAQEQIDRDVIRSRAVGKGGEDAQDAPIDAQVEAEAATDSQVVGKTLRQGGHARPPSTGQARAIERNPSISCRA